MKEIGSEFWKIDEEELNGNNNKYFKFGKDIQFTFLGRTAINFVLQDILKNKKVQTVYFPSYCCDSMIKPFTNNKIKVKYYNVYYDRGLKYKINENEECDIFFAMNYFGYSSTNMEKYILKFKKRGATVIEDITHSIFSKKKFCKNSDYLIGSLRKWMPIISGGIAVKMKGKFNGKLKKIKKSMIIAKDRAMKLKKMYMENENAIYKIKEDFLKDYNKFNLINEDNYENFAIDNYSMKIIETIDLDKIIKIRKNNAKYIYNELRNNNDIKFLIENYDEEDCLLFIPIILDNTKRDNLQKIMIENNIYLPIHWKQSQHLSEIPEQELSLICDQRYTTTDIEKYVNLIKTQTMTF